MKSLCHLDENHSNVVYFDVGDRRMARKIAEMLNDKYYFLTISAEGQVIKLVMPVRDQEQMDRWMAMIHLDIESV